MTYIPLPVDKASGAVSVSLAQNAAQMDTFGRLRTTENNTIFESQTEYGLDTRTIWDAVANGTFATQSSNGSVTASACSVGPRNTNTRLTPITIDGTNGHYAILQSKAYYRYVPGHSHVVFITGIFSPGNVTNTVAHTGYFDENNGVLLEIASGVASFISRSSTSGTVVDTKYPQSAWNQDKLDGTGPSGVTIDFTKTQLMFIEASWLGVGPVNFGFFLNGKMVLAHSNSNSNTVQVPYSQTFNLPVRMKLKNVGASTGATIYFNCCSVQSENGTQQQGFPWSTGTGTTAVAVTTRRPILTIRPKTTFNGNTNRAHIEMIDISMWAKTNDSYFEVIMNGTLGGGTAFSSVAADSTTEFDTASTTVSGGYLLVSGYAVSGGGSGSNSTADLSFSSVDTWKPLVLSQVEAWLNYQPTMTLVCTSMSGTSNVAAVMNWHERTI